MQLRFINEISCFGWSTFFSRGSCKLDQQEYLWDTCQYMFSVQGSELSVKWRPAICSYRLLALIFESATGPSDFVRGTIIRPVLTTTYKQGCSNQSGTRCHPALHIHTNFWRLHEHSPDHNKGRQRRKNDWVIRLLFRLGRYFVMLVGLVRMLIPNMT